MTALETLIAGLSDVCAALPDRRKSPRRACEYTMSDIGLSAFSLFFMGSASFLDYQRRLEEGHERKTQETLIWNRWNFTAHLACFHGRFSRRRAAQRVSAKSAAATNQSGIERGHRRYARTARH